MVIRRSKEQIFSYIKEKVINKLKGWKARLLNQVGKEVLLKPVILAMPTYVVAFCKLLKGLCEDICKEMVKFRLGKEKKRRKFIG